MHSLFSLKAKDQPDETRDGLKGNKTMKRQKTCWVGGPYQAHGSMFKTSEVSYKGRGIGGWYLRTGTIFSRVQGEGDKGWSIENICYIAIKRKKKKYWGREKDFTWSGNGRCFLLDMKKSYRLALGEKLLNSPFKSKLTPSVIIYCHCHRFLLLSIPPSWHLFLSLSLTRLPPSLSLAREVRQESWLRETERESSVNLYRTTMERQ